MPTYIEHVAVPELVDRFTLHLSPNDTIFSVITDPKRQPFMVLRSERDSDIVCPRYYLIIPKGNMPKKGVYLGSFFAEDMKPRHIFESSEPFPGDPDFTVSVHDKDPSSGFVEVVSDTYPYPGVFQERQCMDKIFTCLREVQDKHSTDAVIRVQYRVGSVWYRMIFRKVNPS